MNIYRCRYVEPEKERLYICSAELERALAVYHNMIKNTDPNLRYRPFNFTEVKKKKGGKK
jgi:hypothetical protein